MPLSSPIRFSVPSDAGEPGPLSPESQGEAVQDEAPQRASGQPRPRRSPGPVLTALASALIVLVTATIVSSLISGSGGAAPGLRKPTARPSILEDAGYVVKRTTGPGIERY